ncbi:MAG: type II toxin-antitoxin system HicA family toxin [Chthoniobacter sp.]
MKIPRDLSGLQLAKALRALNYKIVRQEGSHLRLTTERDGEHHVTVPAHTPLKVGTLNSILKLVAAHHRISVGELLHLLEL